MCDLLCSCFSKSEILRCGERRWREYKEEEWRKKGRGEEEKKKERGEVEEGEGKSILTEVLGCQSNHLCHYKPLFLLMEGKEILLGGGET